MPRPASWSAAAFNPVPGSENRIHSDETARTYGFRGGLVPGVVVSAYLLHPAAVAWGRDFVERGCAHATVRSPVYDGETFRVEVSDATDHGYEARLVDERDDTCATAAVSLPERCGKPPVRRGDPLLFPDDPRPLASRTVMEDLRKVGLRALPVRFSEKAEISGYLRDTARMAPVFRDEHVATPAFVLGLTNWVLARNVRMPAWLHLETDSRFFRAIELDTDVVTEASIAGLFERKGHHFVDVDVAAFDAKDDAALAAVRLRAIYRLRES